MAIWLASERYAGVTTNGRSVPAQNAYSSGLNLAFSKQPHGSPHEERDHHQVDKEGAEPWEVILAGGVGDAEDDRGDERAADRAEAANRHDDQHVDEDHAQGQRRLEADHLDGECAAERG